MCRVSQRSLQSGCVGSMQVCNGRQSRGSGHLNGQGGDLGESRREYIWLWSPNCTMAEMRINREVEKENSIVSLVSQSLNSC